MRITPKKPTPVERSSVNLVTEQIERLKEIFPEVVTEGKVDFEKLKATLGEVVDDRPERYSFTWAGKRDAIRLLQMPSRATLKPCPDESVDWETTKHVFIEGENLEVLKLLYKSYAGRVKMIYIDQPYNTGNDFIYPDNFADPLDTYLKLTGQKSAEGNLLTSNPETGGRYHSAWLSMMYPRLFVARQLLQEDGVIFVSIDDHEVYNLRVLMNEIFGGENFVASVIWQKMYAPKSSAKHFSEDHDFIVVYAKNASLWRADLLPRTEDQDSVYTNPDDDPRGPWRPNNLAARNYYSKGSYSIRCPGGREIPGPPKGSYWRVSEERLWELHRQGRIWWGRDGNNVPAPKIYLSEVKQGRVPQTLWFFKDVGHTQEAKKELLEFVDFGITDNVLDTVKPTRLIQRILQVSTSVEEESVILDFFAGSASLAHAVLKQNREDGGRRRFVCVQLPERLPIPEKRLHTIADIGKERIRRVIQKLKEEAKGQQKLFKGCETPEDLGFRVFKLAESNYRQWGGLEERAGEKYAAEMELFTDPLLPGSKVEDVVWEVALKEGYGLSSTVEEVKGIKGNRVRRVTDPDHNSQSFLVCLDDTLKEATVRALKLGKDDLFVCRDAALTDEQAANLALTCKLKTI